jgi:hypothetical protein
MLFCFGRRRAMFRAVRNIVEIRTYDTRQRRIDMTIRRLLIVSMCALLGASAAAAKPKHKRAVFVPADHTVIVAYYQSSPHGLPPGLAKRGSLPPGLQKQLWERGTLPLGLAKKIAPFPVALERQLGPCPRGYRRGLLDGRAILYDPGAAAIVDSFVINVSIGR